MKEASLLVISLLSTFESAKVDVGRERKASSMMVLARSSDVNLIFNLTISFLPILQLESDGLGLDELPALQPKEELRVTGELATNP
jgi:hypothetical protein